MNSGFDFIELNRTFHKLSKDSNPHDDIDISLGFGVGEKLRWTDLIQEYRLIILSEAGSGKTCEIRNIAHMQYKQGRAAFFLRLENVAKDFEDAFEVGSHKAFKDWLVSGEEGWLFLDSVDEARLRNPRDFELAIRKLGRRIRAAINRTHIFITSRTTAWRPKTDLAHCIAHLPCEATAKSGSDIEVEEDDPSGSLQIEIETQDKAKPLFKVVTLDNLTSDQVEVFANARGIKDTKAFLDAVERADAWSFTSRPQDLEELTEFWIEKGGIGSRLELMRNSIERRLAERDQDRADARPLSPERARHGARLLAAATTMAQDSTIRIPDGADNPIGIPVQSILPDWDDTEQSTLLSRPIFDEAIYGAVRFHHRTVREYLTAEWFNELLKRETSRRTIEKLFFRKQYGLNIVVPKLRPILPWMAIMDEKIRERILKVAPEIIFEGGDPRQLPLEIRRHTLKDVCEQMADDVTGRSIKNYAEVQRFSTLDMTDDVRVLIRKYMANEDLSEFLLRMVWLGQLVGALPEAMEVALTPKAEHYTRIAAFRAVKAIGSVKDQEIVRQSFLAEASELNRKCIAELIEAIQPTKTSLTWLLACLEKSEPKERYAVDGLTDRINEFVSSSDIELLPLLIKGLNRLLNLPPVIERRNCEVSAKFQWLMAPASIAVEILILARHPAALGSDALSIMHKISAVRDYGHDDLIEVKADFSKIVPEWKELNRALFWSEIKKSREALDRKRNERLINYWHASIFGSVWRFDEGDFDYVTGEISTQAFLDDKLVALSLAFHLYKVANRPRRWREQLKKKVKGNDELSEALKNYFRPSPQSQEVRRWKQEEARWKRRQEARRKKQEKYHADWKISLNMNLHKNRTKLSEEPGTITNPIYYLFQQARKRKNTSMRWTEYNWKSLIPDYGAEVARFYRDGVVSFWRHHEPQLRSQGASHDSTTYYVIIGLAGLEIESTETKNWATLLSTAEVKLACKYASFELNGFPNWLPGLFRSHSEILCDFCMQEVQYELSVEKPDKNTHYILDDLRWSGQWAWDQLAPEIYEILKKEPKNLSNLDKLLIILQRSTLPNDQIEKLASRKCRTLKRIEHAARWFAVWTGVAPERAISALKNKFGNIADSKDQTLFAMTFVTHLLGDRRGDGASVRHEFKAPKFLKSLYLLMHEHIRRGEDVNRVGAGAYSPGLRDYAQDARNSLFELLNQISGKESYLALSDIAKAHPEESFRPWMRHYAKKKAEQDGDIEPWSPSQVREFHVSIESTPSNHRELAELAILRFLDLKDDLEHGDSSIANILKTVTKETEMRKYIGRELREKAFGRYSIPQEEELADAKRPDLRVHGVEFDGPVPVELKLADNSWSGPKLFERLENQLCGDYLRDKRSNFGIFVLVYRGDKNGWEVPGKNVHVDFAELVSALQAFWLQISPKYPKVYDISVIGIDLTKRSS